MGRAIHFRLPRGARRTLQELDRLLDDVYGAPEAELDNKDDPLDEAVYIVLSFQTDLKRCKLVWKDLKAAFPTWEQLAQATKHRVVRVLRLGGLQEQKARTIQKLLAATKETTGSYSLDFLHDMDNDEAERFLTRLPGLSWKAARCVLLYSLRREVFPIDGNSFRVLKRTGVLGERPVYRRRGLHDALQNAVNKSRRKPFHVNLVVHGQRTCLPRRPRCASCAARGICQMRGVPPDVKTNVQRDDTGDSDATRIQLRSPRT